MPFYKWTGIDLLGNLHYGEQFANSLSELSNLLLLKEIGLVKAYDYKIYWLFKRIDIKTKAEFIHNLAILLESKVRLYNALQISISTIKHKYFKVVLEDVALSVRAGTNFDEALSAHKNVFDSVTIALISMAQETGNLDKILQARSENMIVLENFRKKVYSSLISPIITGSFFIILMLIIFLFIIPKFKSFFTSFKEPLPSTTQFIFNLSDWMNSYNAFIALIGFLIGLFFLVISWNWSTSIKIRSNIKWHLPFFNKFYSEFYISYFLQLLSILLRGNIQLPKALNIIEKNIQDPKVKSNIRAMQEYVNSGQSLSLSISKSKLFFNPELQALIEVGELSDLSKMVLKASHIYQERVYKKVHKLSVLISPLILIILGLSIGALIFALYMPLLTLSYVIT